MATKAKTETLKFTAANDFVKEVKSQSESVATSLSFTLSKDAMNLHKFDKAQTSIVDSLLNARKKCATISAVISVVYTGKDLKAVRGFAKNDFASSAKILSLASNGYTRKASHTSLSSMESALKELAETYKGANLVLRTISAIAEENEIPAADNTKVAFHWFNAFQKVNTLAKDDAVLLREKIAEETKKLLNDAEWNPLA